MIIKLNPQKIRADSLILLSIVGMIVILLVFFHRIFIMSLMVFPMSALFLNSTYKIGYGLFKRKSYGSERVKNIMYGLLGIPFSVFILYLLFSQPIITREYIIYFLGIVIIIIGLAGIFKGVLIDVYSVYWRIINIFVSIATIFITIWAYIFADALFFLIIIVLPVVLILNAIFRATMYLSEYHISLKHLKSKKIVKFLFEIISEIPIIEVDDEVSEYITI